MTRFALYCPKYPCQQASLRESGRRPSWPSQPCLCLQAAYNAFCRPQRATHLSTERAGRQQLTQCSRRLLRQCEARIDAFYCPDPHSSYELQASPPGCFRCTAGAPCILTPVCVQLHPFYLRRQARSTCQPSMQHQTRFLARL